MPHTVKPKNETIPGPLVVIAEHVGRWMQRQRLEHNRGPDNPLLATDIIAEYRTVIHDHASLRKVINHLRANAWPIAARQSGTGGYWFALEATEITDTIQRLAGKERAMRRARIGMQDAFPKQIELDFT